MRQFEVPLPIIKRSEVFVHHTDSHSKTESPVTQRTGMDSILPTDSLIPQSKCIKVVDEDGKLR